MFEKFDNETIALVIVGAIAITGMVLGQSDIGLAVASGIVGYLTKAVKDLVK